MQFWSVADLFFSFTHSLIHINCNVIRFQTHKNEWEKENTTERMVTKLRRTIELSELVESHDVEFIIQ